MATRAEVLAEIERRGLKPPSAPTPSAGDYDKEALRAEAKRRGLRVGSRAAPEPNWEQKVARGLGQFGSGVVESAADTVGLLPDKVAQLARYAGVPVPGGDRTVRDWLAGNGEWLAGAPETQADRAARGAGRGVADAAALFLPAGAAVRAAKVGGGLSGRVAQMLAAAPKTQAVAGGVGGAVGGAVPDDPLLAAGAAMAVPGVAGAAKAGVAGMKALPGVIGRAMVPNPSNMTGGALGAMAGAATGDPLQALAWGVGGAVSKEALDSLLPYLKQQIASGNLSVQDALAMQAKIVAAQASGQVKR